MQGHTTGVGQSSVAAAEKHRFAVHSVRELTGSVFVLRFDRHDLDFRPGQHLHLGVPGSMDMREYSIFSGVDDPYFEVLIKEIEEGLVSRQLRSLGPGDLIDVKGPFGFFTLPDDASEHQYLFVATGTGIAPFRCFVLSQPDLRYRLLHGVRFVHERYASECFEPARTTACLTRPDDAATYEFPWFDGRVTKWLAENPIDTAARCYLCGSCDMIYDAFDILKDRGVPTRHIFAEVYF